MKAIKLNFVAQGKNSVLSGECWVSSQHLGAFFFNKQLNYTVVVLTFAPTSTFYVKETPEEIAKMLAES